MSTVNIWIPKRGVVGWVLAEHEFFSIIYNDNPLLSEGWEGDGCSRKKNHA